MSIPTTDTAYDPLAPEPIAPPAGLPTDPAMIVAQAYRTAVLTNIDENGDIKAGNRGNIIVTEDENGMAQIVMEMPDGSIEYWQQVEDMHNDATGFQAMAFERRNEDGTTFMNTGRQPQVIATFPGDTGAQGDAAITQRVIDGDIMADQYTDVDVFMDRVAEGMRDRAEAGTHGLGQVTIAAHSRGCLALGAACQLEDQLGIDGVQTILHEPFGAGQALEQLAAREAYDLHGDQATQQQIQDIADRLASDVISIRSDDETIFSGLQIGDETYDNAMVGQTFRFTSPDAGITDRMTDHTLDAFITSVVEHGNDSVTRTGDDDLSATQILDGGRDLMGFEQWWTDIKTDMYQSFMSVRNVFNAVASVFNREDPTMDQGDRPEFNDDDIIPVFADNQTEQQQELTHPDPETEPALRNNSGMGMGS